MLPCLPGFHPQLVRLLLQALRLPLQRGLLLLRCSQEALLLLICSPEGLELFRQPRVSIWIISARSPACKSEVSHSCFDFKAWKACFKQPNERAPSALMTPPLPSWVETQTVCRLKSRQHYASHLISLRSDAVGLTDAQTAAEVQRGKLRGMPSQTPAQPGARLQRPCVGCAHRSCAAWLPAQQHSQIYWPPAQPRGSQNCMHRLQAVIHTRRAPQGSQS